MNACSDTTRITSLSDSTDETRETFASKGSIPSEFGEIEAFDLRIKPEGPFKPNRPFTITVEVYSRVETEKAELKLMLPEFTGVRKAEQQDLTDQVITHPLGKPFTPELSIRKSFGKDEEFKESKRFSISEPGYYRVIADIESVTDQKFLNDLVPIDFKTRKELWIWIDEDGGRITEKFDEDVFPEGVHKVAGPLSPLDGKPRFKYAKVDSNTSKDEYSIDEAGTTVSSNAASSITFTYTDPQTDAEEPVTGAPAEVTIRDEYENKIIDQYWDETDSNGKIERNCDPQYESIQAELYSKDSDITVSYDGSSKASSTGKYPCGYDIPRGSNSKQVYVWYQMQEIIDDSRSYFDKSRGHVPLNIDPEEEDNSFYSPGNDKITIMESHADGGDRGDYVLAHEYGHAFHEKGLGGNEGSGNCPRPHYVNGAYNFQCAYSEGFAQYFAEALGFDSNNLENKNRALGCLEHDDDGFCTEWQNEPDGSIVEGAVGSFFLDITDPANEPHDNLELPGRYVADIIETCEVYDSGWKRADGVDHLIACFENRLPGYTEYFPERSSAPTDYDEAVSEPSGWVADEVRRLWLENLYREEL